MSRRRPSDHLPAIVYGRDDLTCPLNRGQVRRARRVALAYPWRGDQMLDGRHAIDTTAITEPGRLTRIMVSFDVGYHQSGWFANSEWEQNLHLSVSHPRPDRLRWHAHVGRIGMEVETPSDAEARAWGRVFFGKAYPMSWFEPAVGPDDPYRMPGVVHLRLFVNGRGEPFMPKGEAYALRPFKDGSSPAKILDGRAGADVR